MSRDELPHRCADAALASQLDNMLANLNAHIEARAQELAQPLIYDVREAAATEVKTAQGKQQRAEDLVDELRRQIRALEWGRNEQKQRAEKAEAAVARVRRLCNLTIEASCRVEAINQARDTLAVLDREEHNS